MGEYAEMLLEGYACAECGECFLDDDANGFPRYCEGCEPDDEPRKPVTAKSVSCPGCARKFHDRNAMEQHRTAKGHVVVKSVPCPGCARKFHDCGAMEQHRAAKGH